MWLAFSVECGKDAADTKVKGPGLLTQYPSRTEPAESTGVDGHYGGSSNAQLGFAIRPPRAVLLL
jgi:hypothetical protein